MKRISSEPWAPRRENGERDLGSIQRLVTVLGGEDSGKALPSLCIDGPESMGQREMLSLAGIGQWKLNSRCRGR